MRNPFGSLCFRRNQKKADKKVFPALSRPQAFSRTWKRAAFLAASQMDQVNESTNPRGWMRDYTSTPFGGRLDEVGWDEAWFSYLQTAHEGAEAYDHCYIWSGSGIQPETSDTWGCVTSPEQLTYYWTPIMHSSWPTFRDRVRDELGMTISLYSGLMNTPTLVIDGTRSVWNTGVGGATYSGTEWLSSINYNLLADEIARLRDEGYMTEQFGMDAFYFVELERQAQSVAFAERLCNVHGIKACTEGPHAYIGITEPYKRKQFALYAEMGVTDGGNLLTGTAQGGTSNTITLAAGASGTNDTYNGRYIAANGETKKITDYDGTTKVATVDSNWTTTPTGATTYRMYTDVTLDTDWGTFIGIQREAYIASRAPGAVKLMFGNNVWTIEQKATLRAECASRGWLEVTVPGYA